MTFHQASAIAIGGRALLIEGPPGAGKSSLALALIDRGAVLIGDDGVALSVTRGRVLAGPPGPTHGLIEVRNLGILNFPVASPAPVALVIRLGEEAPRFIEAADTATLIGIDVPLIHLVAHDPLLPLKAELALTHYGLAAG